MVEVIECVGTRWARRNNLYRTDKFSYPHEQMLSMVCCNAEKASCTGPGGAACCEMLEHNVKLYTHCSLGT